MNTITTFENGKMYAKLRADKTFHRSFGTRKQHNAMEILNRHAGEWVEIETEYLFNNQYNITLEGVGIRIFDADISEIRNDKRGGVITCAYCGKQFKNEAEYTAHVEESRVKACDPATCKNCFWYGITETLHTDRRTELGTDADGNETETIIETCTYKRGCTYKKRYNNEKSCKYLECTNREYRKTFTPENTYFLKYPKGYDGYFRELSTVEKWRELGFEEMPDFDDGRKVYTKSNFVGGYDLTARITTDGVIELLTLTNTRRIFRLESDFLKAYFNGSWSYLRYVSQQNGDPLKDFPKTLFDKLSKAFDTLKEDYRHKAYISEFIKF